MKLDIGGGHRLLTCFEGNSELYHPENYFVVDEFSLDKPNTIKANAWDIPLPDNSVDEIYSSHLLEHVHHEKTIQTLDEWYRILKVNGRLQLHVPDLEYCCRTWLNTPEEDPIKYEWNMFIIFGKGEYPGDEHRQGFTTKRIQNLLNKYPYSGNVTNFFCSIHNQMEIRADVYKSS